MTQAPYTEAAQIARARANERRIGEIQGEINRLKELIEERRATADRQTDERVAAIIRGEVERLEGNLASLNTELQGELSSLRTRQDDFDARLSTESGRVTTLVGRVDGLQAHSEAHATAISRLEAANGWIPVIGALVATLLTYFILEGVELLREDRFATHIQWFWAVLVGAGVGLLLTLIPGNGRGLTARSSASSNATVATPAPPQAAPVVATAPQPALVSDQVLPAAPQPTPAGVQLPTTPQGAVAAANAHAAASVN